MADQFYSDVCYKLEIMWIFFRISTVKCLALYEINSVSWSVYNIMQPVMIDKKLKQSGA